jgi:Aminotransferase class I and II
MTMEMKKNGQTVYSLCVGEPDYQPPDAVLKATGETAFAGNTKYTSVNGDAKLRASIAADLKRRKGLDYSADQIVVSNGAKQSVIQALLSTVGPGDDVIIPAPYWPSYPGGPTATCTTPHQHPTQLTRPAGLSTQTSPRNCQHFTRNLHPGTVTTYPAGLATPASSRRPDMVKMCGATPGTQLNNKTAPTEVTEVTRSDPGDDCRRWLCHKARGSHGMSTETPEGQSYHSMQPIESYGMRSRQRGPRESGGSC